MKDFWIWYVSISCAVTFLSLIFNKKRLSWYAFIILLVASPVFIVCAVLKGVYSKIRLINNIDSKFAKIGFVKVKEDDFGATYEKSHGDGHPYYTQVIHILHKTSSFSFIQSYDKSLNKDGFNNMVGLSVYEAALSLKKAKQMGWKELKEVRK